MENSLRVYYLSRDGDDRNDGLSEAAPIRTVARLNELTAGRPLQAGEGLRFHRGHRFEGTLRVEGAMGAPDRPVTLTGYGEGDARPCITAPPTLTGGQVRAMLATDPACGVRYNEAAGEIRNGRVTCAIEIDNCRHIVIDGVDGYSDNNGEDFYQYVLDVSAVFRISNARGVRVRNCHFQAEVKRRIKDYIADVLGKDRELIGVFPGWDASYPPYRGNDYNAIIVEDSHDPANTDMTNIVIENITATGVMVGLSISKSSQFTVRGCRVYDSPCWGFSVGDSHHGQILECETRYTGYGLNPNGNAAFMVSSCQHVVFDGLRVKDSEQGPQPYDGVAFDFEGGIDQHHITLKNTHIDGCYGAGVMIFTNTDGNKDVVLDNVFIRNYNKNGTPEGAVNFCWPEPDNYANTVALRHLVVERHTVGGEPMPFYSLHPRQWPTVAMEDCLFLEADDRDALDSAYRAFLDRCPS